MMGRIAAALRRPRLAGVLLVCASVGLIVLITLSPFDLSCRNPSWLTGRPSLRVGWGRSSVSDVLLNALLFMPFGFGLSHVLSWRRLAGPTALAVVFGACVTLSYTIEVLQQCLPARFPAWRDVLANSFGGVLGWSGFQSRVWWGRQRLREDGRT
jgi:glycopeptide antibiotics resistance protein